MRPVNSIIKALDLKSIRGYDSAVVHRSKQIFADAGLVKEKNIALVSKWLDWRNRPEISASYSPPRLIGDDENNPDWKKRGVSDSATFASCVGWRFNIEESSLTLTIWEGDNTNGERKSLRCEFVITAALETMLDLYKGYFEQAFKNALWEHIEDAREAELIAIEAAARTRIENKLFAKIKQ